MAAATVPAGILVDGTEALIPLDGSTLIYGRKSDRITLGMNLASECQRQDRPLWIVTVPGDEDLIVANPSKGEYARMSDEEFAERLTASKKSGDGFEAPATVFIDGISGESVLWKALVKALKSRRKEFALIVSCGERVSGRDLDAVLGLFANVFVTDPFGGYIDSILERGELKSELEAARKFTPRVEDRGSFLLFRKGDVPATGYGQL